MYCKPQHDSNRLEKRQDVEHTGAQGAEGVEPGRGHYVCWSSQLGIQILAH